jgi:hypothetical protein
MNQYKLFLDTTKYLHDENGMRLLNDEKGKMITYHDIKCNVSISPVIKINSTFVDGDSLSIECKGPKKSHGLYVINFDQDTSSSWFEGLDGYYYFMSPLCNYTFSRYGEAPFVVLKGKSCKNGLIIEDLIIYDLVRFLGLCYSQSDMKKYNFRVNESYDGNYYDYTMYFNTSVESKL